MPSSASSNTQLPSFDDSTDDKGLSPVSSTTDDLEQSPVSSMTDDLGLSPVSSTTEDCRLSPVSYEDWELSAFSSTEGETLDFHYTNVHGLTGSGEDTSNKFLELRSNGHAGLCSHAPSAVMTLCPNSYVQRSTRPNILRKVTVPPSTGVPPMNAFLGNSYPWCYLELGPPANTISTGAEDNRATRNVETMHYELKSNGIDSPLRLDSIDCQKTLHAKMNKSHFPSASGNYARIDNDTAASLAVTGSAPSNKNCKPTSSPRAETNTFVPLPLLSTIYADGNHVKTGNDNKERSATVILPGASATGTTVSETSCANVTSWTSYAPEELPAQSSTENFMSPFIAALWETHALVRVRVGTDDVQVFDLRKELDLTNFNQRKDVNNAANHAPAPESSKRKTRQSSQPEQNKRSKSSRATKGVTELPIVEADGKKSSDATELKDTRSNHKMRTPSKSASVNKETTSSHHIDGSDSSSATETTRQEVITTHTLLTDNRDETKTANDVTKEKVPAVPVSTLEQCDDFYAGATDKDPSVLPGQIAREHLEVKDSE